MSKKALIAMSGGVDSSVAALIMKNNQYECIGATMILADDRITNSDANCCNEENINDAKKVCESIQNSESELGILVCGTGIGMSIAANKHKGIRAAAVSEHFSAKYTRLHNNSNVLCLGGRVIGVGTALELVDLFVNTEFEGGRHQARIDKITQIENK